MNANPIILRPKYRFSCAECDWFFEDANTLMPAVGHNIALGHEVMVEIERLIQRSDGNGGKGDGA